VEMATTMTTTTTMAACSPGICNLQIVGIEMRKGGGSSVQGATTCLPSISLQQRLRCKSNLRSIVVRKKSTLPLALVVSERSNNLQCCARKFFAGEHSSLQQCTLLKENTGVLSPRRRVVCLATESQEETSEVSTTTSSASRQNNIWMSDVMVRNRRPYFFRRKWTSKDMIYGAFIGFMHALCLLAPFTFSWNAFAVFTGLYVITGMLGITLSFHRNLSHKSFKLPKWLEYTFAYCGVQALQGDPLEWVSSHRYHHQYCDTEMDPHTPYEGFWHSHMGWLLDEQPTNQKVGMRGNIGDLEKDRFYQFVQKTYPIHPLMMAVVLYAAGGIPFIVWGMAVRTIWVYHITWFVNSASHVWGKQVWNTGDLSRNNW
jgi:fatty-acid desaturase